MHSDRHNNLSMQVSKNYVISDKDCYTKQPLFPAMKLHRILVQCKPDLPDWLRRPCLHCVKNSLCNDLEVSSMLSAFLHCILTCLQTQIPVSLLKVYRCECVCVCVCVGLSNLKIVNSLGLIGFFT